MLKIYFPIIRKFLVYVFLFITVPGVAVCKLKSQNSSDETMFLRMTINVAYYTKVVILVLLYYMY
jgi:hypothetical protein